MSTICEWEGAESSKRELSSASCASSSGTHFCRNTGGFPKGSYPEGSKVHMCDLQWLGAEGGESEVEQQ